METAWIRMTHPTWAGSEKASQTEEVTFKLRHKERESTPGKGK